MGRGATSCIDPKSPCACYRGGDEPAVSMTMQDCIKSCTLMRSGESLRVPAVGRVLTAGSAGERKECQSVRHIEIGPSRNDRRVMKPSLLMSSRSASDLNNQRSDIRTASLTHDRMRSPFQNARSIPHLKRASTQQHDCHRQSALLNRFPA